MKKELDEQLVKDFPLLYRDRHASVMESCMPWGFDCREGWEPLIRDLSSKLEPLIADYYKKNKNEIRCRTCSCPLEDHVGSATNTPSKCLAIHKTPTKRIKYYEYGYYGKSLWGKTKRFFSHQVSNICHVINKILGLFFYKLFSCHCEKYSPSIPCAAQVKEKYGCYDENTEVLTKLGWKYFKDVTADDEVATLINGSQLYYEKPNDIISYKYSGEMYRLKTRGIDLLVTPNHNLYIAKGTYYNGRYSPPKKITYPFELSTYEKYFGKNKTFKKSADWIGTEQEYFILPSEENYWYNNFGLTNKKWLERKILINDWLNFLGWYIAEGCSNTKTGEISIACNNTDGGTEKLVISKAIENIGYNINIKMEDRPACIFKIYDKRLARWLGKNCGSVSYVKKIPDFVKELSKDSIVYLLNSLYEGDGQKTETANILTTVSKKLSDDVQELLLKIGDVGHISIIPPKSSIYNGKIIKGTCDVYCVNWLRFSQTHSTANKGMAKSSIERIEDYSGMVYCLSVTSNVIFVRRNGIPVWCGNSLRFYMSSYLAGFDKLIGEAEAASEVTCEQCGDPGVLRNNYGWLLTACDTHAVDRDGNPIPCYSWEELSEDKNDV